MSKNINNEILEIQILQQDLLKELQAYNKDIKSYRNEEYSFQFYWSNKHKASFNRLRLELSKRYIKLSKKFKGEIVDNN